MSGWAHLEASGLLHRAGLFLALGVGLVSLSAALAGLLGKLAAARRLSLAGLAGLWLLQPVLVGAVLLRWVEVGHEPWQTLYEVLLLCSAFLALSCLGVRLALREFRRGSIGSALFDLFTAVSAVFAAGLLFYGAGKDDSAATLPPALRSAWMAPHVVAYVFAYAALFIACAGVVTWWLVAGWSKIRPGAISQDTRRWLADFDRCAYAIVAVGFPFLTAALLMGSLWGQTAWGNWWGWDSKEVAALVSWIVYVIYLHLRLLKGWRGGSLLAVLFLGGLSIVVCFVLFSYLPASFSSVHRYAE